MNHCTDEIPKLYCGIDLHSRKSYIYIIDDSGDCIRKGEIETSGMAFQTFFEDLCADYEIRAAIEIGSLTFRYCDSLRSLGIGIHVVNTLKNSYIAKSMKKTDKEDARRLAIQLWKSILPDPVHIPDSSERSLRILMSHRSNLVKDQTRLINRVRYRLRVHEIRPGSRSLKELSKWEIMRTKVLATNDPLLHVQFDQLYHQYRTVLEQMDEIEELIHDQIRSEPDFHRNYDLLCSIPGIGFVTASALIALIGHHVERFQNVRQLMSYFGVCPRVRESGGKSLGNSAITKQGNGAIRGYLTQSALGALRTKNSDAFPLQDFYENIRRRKGWKTARVALSRKMAALAYGVLRYQQPYDPTRVTRTCQSS